VLHDIFRSVVGMGDFVEAVEIADAVMVLAVVEVLADEVTEKGAGARKDEG